MKARILLVENSGRFVGGGQVSFLGLAERLDRSRFEPFVVCPEEGDFLEAVLERGIPALVRPMPSLRGLGGLALPGALPPWLKLVGRYRIDLLHANGTRAMIYAGLAGQLARRPVLWHVRVMKSDGLLDRVLARLSTRVLVNSRAVAERFRFLGSPNGAQGPVIIPNGVDLLAFARARPDPGLRSALGLEGRLVLAVLAQLIPWKRHGLALEVLALLRARGLPAALLLIGDEVPSSRGYRAQLEAEARRLGIDQDCVFTGFRRDVPQLLNLADILLHPAADEPFGRALLEAMAASLPVIVAAGGGVSEVVENGVSGLIVEAGDARAMARAAERLLSDAGLRRRMGEQGRTRAEEKFSIEAHAARLGEIYQEVLGR